MSELPRDFKGIWIPREIWEDRSLTYFEICLFSEIHSLNGKKGCHASNEYLCKFFNEGERKVRQGIAKLKAKGYIYQEAFNGRIRTLRTNLTPEDDKSLFTRSDRQKESVNTLFNHADRIDSVPPSLSEIACKENKDEIKEKTNKQFVCSFDQEKLDLLKGFSLSKKMIEEFCRFTIEELKSSLEAYKQYVDDELSKGNSIDNSIAILRKAIEGRWKPKSTRMKESVKKENKKKNLERVKEEDGVCKIECNEIVFYDKTSLPIDCDPKQLQKRFNEIHKRRLEINQKKDAKRKDDKAKQYKLTEST